MLDPVGKAIDLAAPWLINSLTDERSSANTLAAAVVACTICSIMNSNWLASTRDAVALVLEHRRFDEGAPLDQRLLVYACLACYLINVDATTLLRRAEGAIAPEHLRFIAGLIPSREHSCGTIEINDSIFEEILEANDETLVSLCRKIRCAGVALCSESDMAFLGELLAGRAFVALRGNRIELGSEIVRALRSLRVRDTFPDESVRYLLAQQRADGSFGYMSPFQSPANPERLFRFRVMYSYLSLLAMFDVVHSSPFEISGRHALVTSR